MDQRVKDECCSTHLIDGDGTFNAVGLDNFIKQVKLGECGLSYAVVAIMGPRSSGMFCILLSGKSTLLNHLFYTNFEEMDAYRGRYKTTKGIWIARCVAIEPCIVVMDLEGTDGRDREDDTAFEKQSALFALAVSDIVLINMWCHDIWRERASSKLLLQTVFQVMLRLFNPRKTTLMFVIRDKTRIPLENLELVLREDIQKIWHSVPKPEANKHTPLSEFFSVEVVALSSYEGKKEQFKEQVVVLRQKLLHSIALGGLVGDRQGVVPASSFFFDAQEIWKVIKANKDLDLSAEKVMEATVRCEEIANEKYSSFIANEDWIKLEDAVRSSFVTGFGKKLSSLLNKCLSSYDEEATYFEDNIRSTKRKQLEEKVLQLGEPAYQLTLEHIESGILDNFKKSLNDALSEGQGFAVAARGCTAKFLMLFDEQCEDAVIAQARWDSDITRDEISRDLGSHIFEVRTAKLSELTALYESKLREALYGPVEALLEGGSDDTWTAIRKLLRQEVEKNVFGFSCALSGFEMDEEEKENMINKLKNYARGVIEAKIREESAKALYHMKERFTYLFNHDNDSMPRVWTGMEDIPAITKMARSGVLSVLAAIRLNEESNDTIKVTLVQGLLDSKKGTNSSTFSLNPLASNTWAEFTATNTLITPAECYHLWSHFIKDTEFTITYAIIASQEANRRNHSWVPPLWAIATIVVLVFDKFVPILSHPVWLLVIIVSCVLAVAVWVQQDISHTFRDGELPGILLSYTRFLQIVTNPLRRLAELRRRHVNTPQTQTPCPYQVNITMGQKQNDSRKKLYKNVHI